MTEQSTAEHPDVPRIQLERVLGTVEGRAVVGRLIFDDCALLGLTYSVGGDVHGALYLEGRRSIGAGMANAIASQFPDAWIQIQRERGRQA